MDDILGEKHLCWVFPTSPSRSALCFIHSVLCPGKLPSGACTWACWASDHYLGSTNGEQEQEAGGRSHGGPRPPLQAAAWPWLPLPFLLGSPSLLATALAKSYSSCLSLPLLASRVVLPQHPEYTMLISFHLTRPLNNLFITYSSVSSLSVPCASCQDRKTKHWLERGENSGPSSAQFSSIQQTFTKRGPLKRALCQGLRTHSSLRHGSHLQRAPCLRRGRAPESRVMRMELGATPEVHGGPLGQEW